MMAIIAIIGLSACNRRGNKVLSEKEMIQFLADVSLAQAQSQAGNPGKLPEEQRLRTEESVMAARGITREEMDSTLAWYGRNLEKYYALFDKVDKELARRQKKSNGNLPRTNEADNLWPYSAFAWFAPQSPTQGLTFSMPSADMKPGESLIWKMRFNNSPNIKAMIGVDYTDNTSTVMTASTYGQREFEVELLTDTAKKVSRIYGSLYIPKESLPLWADSISLTKAPFDSLQYYKYRNQRFIRN